MLEKNYNCLRHSYKMAKKKIVIKVNYDKLKTEPVEPEMITEWNIKRIVMVLFCILLFMAGAGFLLLNKNPEIENKGISAKNKPVESHVVLPHAEKPVVKETVAAEKKKINSEEKKRPPEIADKKSIQNKADIYDNRISRAVLAFDLKEKEPVDPVTGDIIAKRDKAVGVYYFTEINNMKGKVLFHEWYWNNQLIFRRKLNIIGKHWRASTSKLIPYSKRGHWKVRLVDADNNVLSRVEFNVI